MDQSTQRMLERARARRQKLDEQLKTLGIEASHRKIPLQESNTQFVKVTTEVEVVLNSSDNIKNVNVSPTKVEVSSSGEKENEILSSREKLPSMSTSSKDSKASHERNIRSQLKRLGALYSDAQLSSPIHRTENVFAVEADSSVKTAKPAARVARLAALADNIKQWEDDLSHPNFTIKETDSDVATSHVIGTSNKIENVDQDLKPGENNTHSSSNAVKESAFSDKSGVSRFTNTQVGQLKKEEVCGKLISKGAEIKQGNKNSCDTGKMTAKHSQQLKEVTPKKIVWDEKVIQLLEAQGFSRSVSKCRLIYDYSKPSSQDDVNEASATKPKSPQRTMATAFAKKNDVELREGKDRSITGGKQFSETSKISQNVKGNSPEKPVETKNVNKYGIGSSPTKGLGSPVKLPPGSPKAGSVLEKASMFESSSPSKKTKDPAELSLSERLALFERNKGQALIPKAAFSMPVPAKYLESENKMVGSSPEKIKVFKTNQPEKACGDNSGANICNKVLSCRQLFEKGVANEPADKLVNEQFARQNELEMLRNRWNKNKSLATETQDEKVPSQTTKVFQGTVPAPPPLPDETCMSPIKSSPALPQVTCMIPKNNENDQISIKNVPYESPTKKFTPIPKINEKSDVCKIKKIKVSPPKPGHLYPCLSDIEATTTEAESEVADDTERDSASSIASDSDDGNSSFGREILQAAGINNAAKANDNMHSNYSDSSNSDLSESAVLADIEGCIDDALVGYDSSSDSENEGPTPPKKSREYLHSPQKGKRNTRQSPNSKTSLSFKYSAGSSGSPLKANSPVKSPEKGYLPTSVVDGDQEMSLMHSVSFYRKQQNLAVKNTPVRQIIRPPETVVKMESEASSGINEEQAIRKKITDLLDEVSKQQIVISQASQALNLCTATVEFSGSAEQVEGERLLLLATHKRQAALHEVQRLKVEGTLKPLSEAGTNVSLNKGSLMLTNIILSLKKDYIRRLPAEDSCYHFMCLVRSQDQVLGTQVLAASPQNLQDGTNLIWNSPLRLVNLYSDFKVTLEVYSLQSRREMLPHNVKYHIGNKKDTSKSWLTPKKLKHESLLVKPSLNSPAGPSAVRTPEFRMAGYVVFSLKEITRNHFTLNKVSYSSPLEGNIQVKMKSELSVDVCERGFLTMFEDVSGFGAWHRRWFVLKGTILAYWKYPDDEKKIPIGQIDLNTCSTIHVGLVSRDICARPNTFLLETARPAQPDDRDSLVMIKSGDTTIIRVLLSADTKEERLVWCAQINKALSLMRAWGNKQDES